MESDCFNAPTAETRYDLCMCQLVVIFYCQGSNTGMFGNGLRLMIVIFALSET